MRCWQLTLSGLVAGLISACSTLPSSGPKAKDIQDEYQSAAGRDFELVNITPATIATLNQRTDSSLFARFGDYRPSPDPKIGIGDGLVITIWEAGQGGLFSSPSLSVQNALEGSSKGATIPEQIVNREGQITVPFVGPIAVAGRTPFEVQQAIESGLAGKAAKPQVLVTQSRNVSSVVTIVGEVVNGARIPLSVRGEKLLDIIASAGGVRTPIHEAFVQLTRDDTSASVPLQQILKNPQENIFMRAGDVVAITRRPQTFTAFGATGRNAQVPFDAMGLSLVEALAKSGGLLDSLADPRGVYLLRIEPPPVARAVAAGSQATERTDGVPVIYQIDMTKAGSYFLAQSFTVRDRDVIYASGARANELQKFLQLVGLLTQPVLTGVAVENSVNN